MAARLQRHISRCAFRFFSSHLECICLRMAFASLQMGAKADDASFLHENTADDRIDARLSASALRQLQSQTHIKFIVHNGAHNKNPQPADCRRGDG
ncbi:hypothetical protein D3C84_1013730 [compost metagenome]